MIRRFEEMDGSDLVPGPNGGKWLQQVLTLVLGQLVITRFFANQREVLALAAGLVCERYESQSGECHFSGTHALWQGRTRRRCGFQRLRPLW